MDDGILITLQIEPARQLPGGAGVAGAPGPVPLRGDGCHPGRGLGDWLEDLAGAALLFVILAGLLFIGEGLGWAM